MFSWWELTVQATLSILHKPQNVSQILSVLCVKASNSFKWQTTKHFRTWKLSMCWEAHLLLQPLSLLSFHQWSPVTLSSFLSYKLVSMIHTSEPWHVCFEPSFPISVHSSFHLIIFIFNLYVTTSEKPSLTTLAKVPLHYHIPNLYLPYCFYFPHHYLKLWFLFIYLSLFSSHTRT